jgi:hypothetical protein
MSSVKRYRFFYHLNKPETKKLGKVVWSIHYRNQCILANHLDIRVPTESREQTTRQPYAKMVGNAAAVTVDSNGTAIIT